MAKPAPRIVQLLGSSAGLTSNELERLLALCAEPAEAKAEAPLRRAIQEGILRLESLLKTREVFGVGPNTGEPPSSREALAKPRRSRRHRRSAERRVGFSSAPVDGVDCKTPPRREAPRTKSLTERTRDMKGDRVFQDFLLKRKAVATGALAVRLKTMLQDRRRTMLRFCVGELTDPTVLAARLKSGADPLSRHLNARFSEATLRLLSQQDLSQALSTALLEALVADLNRVLEAGEPLYSPERSEGIVLTPEARRLGSQRLEGAALVRYNRLLLQQGFPQCFAENDLPVAKTLPDREASHLGRDTA